MIQLETKRLIIRDHVHEDLVGLQSLLGDKETMYYIMDLYEADDDGVKRNLETAIQAQTDSKRDKYFFAIVDKLTDEYIGEIGFTILVSPSISDSDQPSNQPVNQQVNQLLEGQIKFAESSLVELGY